MTNNPDPPKKIDVFDLMRYGWLPSGMPPCFESFTMARFFKDKKSKYWDSAVKSRKYTTPAYFSIPKRGKNRRIASIIHPLGQVKLSKSVQANWSAIRAHIINSPISKSTPVLSRDKKRNYHSNKDHQLRFFEQKYTFSESFSERQSMGFGGSAVLHFDIQSHYPSLYIHAITWALTTKVNAKKMFRNEIPKSSAYGIASQLEEAVKYCQDQETKGIAIGNDISLIVSEIIMCEVDKYINNELGKISSYIGSVRYVDDYWIIFSNQDQANDCRQIIEGLLAPFHLILNESKIKTEILPLKIAEEWVSEFHEFKLSAANSIRYKIQLKEFVNRTVTEYRKLQDERIPRYALQILRPFAGKNSLDNVSPFANSKNSWADFERSIALMLQLDKRNIDIIHDILNFYTLVEAVPESNSVLKTILGYLSSCDVDNCYEVSWCLWMLHNDFADSCRSDDVAKSLEMSLRRLLKTESQVILIMILHIANHRKIFSRIFMRDLNIKIWDNIGIRKSHVRDDVRASLYASRWLLTYVCASNGWARLGPSMLDNLFGDMHKSKVKIFDPNYQLSREQILFGTSPRGWGGFKDYDINERLRRSH